MKASIFFLVAFVGVFLLGAVGSAFELFFVAVLSWFESRSGS